MAAIAVCSPFNIQALAQSEGATQNPTANIKWPDQPTAPADAPNILLIMLDDVGFSAASTFGGLIPTPALDRLARQGVSYNRFHTAGVCSPSRAALLTGRNPHQVGIGNVAQLAAGFPGYNSVIQKDTVTVARVLRDNGYSTAAFGKWHLNPAWEITQAGPFERWPTGQGFEYYYGCLACLTEWEPRLFRGTDPISTPSEEDYQLSADLVDQSIKWMVNQKAATPSKPFFMYMATPATHAPVHAPKEWTDRFKGKFDAGWDAMRREVFERQKKAGIIPPDARLAPRPEGIPAWDLLTDNERKLFARQMEVFAGYLAHTDHEIGRLLNRLETSGLSDNTLVIYIVGDNGASAEGGLEGSITNMAMLQGGGQETVEQQLEHADRLGSRDFDLHFAAGWSSAMNTPFPWMKQVASHLGAIRNGMIISWPGHTSQPQAIRGQFSYLTDVTSTIYAASGIGFPDTVDGVKQVPLEGRSLMATFTDPNAPEVRHTQYFDVNGNISIYHDGWMASKFQQNPWAFFSGEVTKPAAEGHKWELYNLDKDFSQTQDLAKRNPEKLREMISLFDEEARRNDVYPLNPPWLVGAPHLEGPTKSAVTYPGEVENLPLQDIPRIEGKSHRITAELVAPEDAEGVILAVGGRYGGFSLYAKNGKLVYASNSLNQVRSTVTSSEPLPSGKLEIVAAIDADKSVTSTSQSVLAGGAFGGGAVKLYVNGREVGSGRLGRFGGNMLNETLDVGKDNGSPVTDDYFGPFPFTGKIESVKLEVLRTDM
ncbi:MAG: arylsulfatase [Novosphingobium sp.]